MGRTKLSQHNGLQSDRQMNVGGEAHVSVLETRLIYNLECARGCPRQMAGERFTLSEE